MTLHNLATSASSYIPNCFSHLILHVNSIDLSIEGQRPENHVASIVLTQALASPTLT